ncbi:unnamed protein product [Adineta ricciae]|uniref:peptidylglycine monooxygenase n=1 Tax=Adineta ricciae TaxID=249248 RepID=A0A814NHZ4_ADIRI|nr:unnamed protein product [Adineta ricciae]CAF1093187.1 unnamed protein product [Adineta ricciae]
MMLLSIILVFSSILLSFASEDASNTLAVLMPDVIANHVDDYLCTSVELDHDKPVYITAFNPSATSNDAHHILLYGCTEPGSEKKVWNCGEMSQASDSASNKYETGPTCASGSTIVYAWALDADKTELPKDVAFKIGATTPIKYLVLQVHYANIDKFKAGQTDRSGLILTTTPNPTPKRAGVFFAGTGGQIEPNSEEIFEAACQIEQNIEMHPFAFRVHAHKLGLVNSAYRVRGEKNEQEWREIGRRSPQLPQMFYPIHGNLTIKKGDYIAIACTMFNSRSHVVRVGPTGDDEMCNFYMMYWVNDDNLLDVPFCQSAGPPHYYFSENQDLNVDKIPSEAFRIPPPPNGPVPGQVMQHDHHTMTEQKKPFQRRQFRNRYTNGIK